MDRYVMSLVRIVIDQFVLLSVPAGGSEATTIHLVGTLLFVHLDVIEGGIVRAPNHRAVAFQLRIMIDLFSRRGVQHAKAILLVAGVIDRVRQQFVTGRLRRGPHVAVVPPLGQGVLVEVHPFPRQDGGLGRAVPFDGRHGVAVAVAVSADRGSAAMGAITLPLVRAGVIEPRAVPPGTAVIRLPQASHHLVVQFRSQSVQFSRHRRGVLVLLLQ
mmetsp:Transcript_35887/g.107166  ORF Transcript_35887/g.107166 Transcript_35887/m.107166 type:complete len:215 (-) Transcript_35887:274-918(-)